MYQLFYVSTAAPDLPEAAIAPLVEKAAVRNARLGISGALAFNGTNFAQVLEGERDVVETLMVSIRRDARHSGLIVVYEGECDRRRWDGWSMTHLSGLDFSPLLASLSHN